jgi:hypothetical protein
MLQCFNAAMLRCFIQCFNASDLQRFKPSMLQHFNTKKPQHSNALMLRFSTRQPFNPLILQHSKPLPQPFKPLTNQLFGASTLKSFNASTYQAISVPSNVHMLTLIFQKTVFFSKIFFGKPPPPSNFLEVCLNSEYM